MRYFGFLQERDYSLKCRKYFVLLNGNLQKESIQFRGGKIPSVTIIQQQLHIIIRNTVNNLEVEHINEHDKLSYFLSLTRDNYTCIHFYTNKYIRSSKYTNHTEEHTLTRTQHAMWMSTNK